MWPRCCISTTVHDSQWVYVRPGMYFDSFKTKNTRTLRGNTQPNISGGLSRSIPVQCQVVLFCSIAITVQFPVSRSSFRSISVNIHSSSVKVFYVSYCNHYTLLNRAKSKPDHERSVPRINIGNDDYAKPYNHVIGRPQWRVRLVVDS